MTHRRGLPGPGGGTVGPCPDVTREGTLRLDGSRHFTDMGPAWHTDPFALAPGPKTLLTLFGAEHGLGGIAGYDAAETTDENPGLVAALAALAAAYLRGRLHLGDTAWQTACEALAAGTEAVGRVETK